MTKIKDWRNLVPHLDGFWLTARPLWATLVTTTSFLLTRLPGLNSCPWVMWIQFVFVQQYPVKEFSIYSIGMFPCSYSLEKLFHFYKVISIHDSDQICVSDLTQSQSQFISQCYLMYHLCFLLMYFPTDHLLPHKIQNGMRLFWALQNIGGQWLSLLNINNCFLFIPISQQNHFKVESSVLPSGHR